MRHLPCQNIHRSAIVIVFVITLKLLRRLVLCFIPLGANRVEVIHELSYAFRVFLSVAEDFHHGQADLLLNFIR
jgi:hypothetical protein